MIQDVQVEVCALMTRQLPFLSFLTDEEFTELSHHFSCRHVAMGTILWREGDPGEYLVFITAGKIQIKISTEIQGKGVVVGIFGPGSVLGEMGVLSGKARGVTATAVEDCDLVMMGKDSFFAMLEEHPELGVKLTSGMLLAVSTRLQKSFERLASIF